MLSRLIWVDVRRTAPKARSEVAKVATWMSKNVEQSRILSRFLRYLRLDFKNMFLRFTRDAPGPTTSAPTDFFRMDHSSRSVGFSDVHWCANKDTPLRWSTAFWKEHRNIIPGSYQLPRPGILPKTQASYWRVFLL